MSMPVGLRTNTRWPTSSMIRNAAIPTASPEVGGLKSVGGALVDTAAVTGTEADPRLVVHGIACGCVDPHATKTTSAMNESKRFMGAANCCAFRVIHGIRARVSYRPGRAHETFRGVVWCRRGVWARQAVARSRGCTNQCRCRGSQTSWPSGRQRDVPTDRAGLRGDVQL